MFIPSNFLNILPLILRGHHGHPIFRLIWASDKISGGYSMGYRPCIDLIIFHRATIQVDGTSSPIAPIWPWHGDASDGMAVDVHLSITDIGVIFLAGLLVQPRSNFWAPGISTSALHLVQAPKSSILSSSKYLKVVTNGWFESHQIQMSLPEKSGSTNPLKSKKTPVPSPEGVASAEALSALCTFLVFASLRRGAKVP